jgi:hypothetical protein
VVAQLQLDEVNTPSQASAWFIQRVASIVEHRSYGTVTVKATITGGKLRLELEESRTTQIEHP